MKKGMVVLLSVFMFVTTQAREYVTILQSKKGAEYLMSPVGVSFKEIVTGYKFSYALDTKGGVWSVGRNHRGQLGLGDIDDRHVWTKTDLTDVTKLEAGWYHAYALKDGVIWSVGDNSKGQTGLGSAVYYDKWKATTMSGFTDIATGAGHGLALKGDELYVVGDDGNGQLGLGSSEDKTAWFDTGIENVKGISAGAGSSYILMNDGTVKSVGLNTSGQLAIGDFTNTNAWQDIGQTNVDKIYGAKFNLFIVKNGELLVSGSNMYYQIGNGTTINQSTMIHSGLSNVQDVYTDRGHHFVYVKNSEGIWQIGLNNGQLGTGNTINAEGWTLTGLSGVSTIALGDQYALFLKKGKVYGTGRNGNGQLALDNTTDKISWTESMAIIEEELEQD